METAHVSGPEDNIVTMTLLPKVVWRLCSPKQNPNTVFGNKKAILEFMWKLKRFQMAKTTLVKKDKVGGLTRPDLKAGVNRSSVVLAQGETQSQKREPGGKPRMCGRLILHKDAKPFRGKDRLLDRMVL